MKIRVRYGRDDEDEAVGFLNDEARAGLVHEGHRLLLGLQPLGQVVDGGGGLLQGAVDLLLLVSTLKRTAKGTSRLPQS
jgi:hypothetical protein